jgi:hypothetical protein
MAHEDRRLLLRGMLLKPSICWDVQRESSALRHLGIDLDCAQWQQLLDPKVFAWLRNPDLAPTDPTPLLREQGE